MAAAIAHWLMERFFSVNDWQTLMDPTCTSVESTLSGRRRPLIWVGYSQLPEQKRQFVRHLTDLDAYR
jgi:hypothetical protein